MASGKGRDMGKRFDVAAEVLVVLLPWPTLAWGREIGQTLHYDDYDIWHPSIIFESCRTVGA